MPYFGGKPGKPAFFPDRPPTPLSTSVLTRPFILLRCACWLLLSLCFFTCFPAWLLKVDTKWFDFSFYLAFISSQVLLDLLLYTWAFFFFFLLWTNFSLAQNCLTKGERGSVVEKDPLGQTASPDTHWLVSWELASKKSYPLKLQWKKVARGWDLTTPVRQDPRCLGLSAIFLSWEQHIRQGHLRVVSTGVNCKFHDD